MIRFLITKSGLKLSKGKGTITVPFIKSFEPDKSKQTTFKEWNEQITKRKQM